MEAFLQKKFWRTGVFIQRSKWLGPYTVQYTHLECLNGSLWWRKKSTSKPCHNKEDYRARAPIFLCVWYLPISAREKEVDFIFFFPSKEQLVVVVLQYKTMNRVLVPTPLYSITSYCFIGSVWLHTFFLGLFFKWHGSKIGPNHKLINYYCLALIVH